MEETAFAIGAFCVAAAIIGGGLKAAHIWDMPVIDSVPRQFLLGVFGAVLMVWSAGIADGDSSADPGRPPATIDFTSQEPTATPGRPDGDGTSGEGCRVTIGNPLAVLKEEPDTFSNDLTQIPAGTYEVEEVRNVTFGPQEQRWFQITVEGRTGFVRDDTFNIASRTDECP